MWCSKIKAMIFLPKCKFNSIYKSKITNIQNKKSNHPTHDKILHIHAATNTQKEIWHSWWQNLSLYLCCHGCMRWVTAQCAKWMIYHASLTLLSILQHSLGVGLVQGPTFNFMLLKREKGHRTKEGRLMPWSGPLRFLQTQTGGADPNLSLLSVRGQLA